MVPIFCSIKLIACFQPISNQFHVSSQEECSYACNRHVTPESIWTFFQTINNAKRAFSHNKFFRVCAFVGPLNVIIEFVGCGGASYYNMQKFPPLMLELLVCSLNLLYLILSVDPLKFGFTILILSSSTKDKKLENFEGILEFQMYMDFASIFFL